MSRLNSEQTIHMGHENSNNVDKIHPFYPELQNSEEIGFQSLSNEAVCCTGTRVVGTVDVPSKVLSNCPSFHMGDMSLTGIDWVTSTSYLDSYQNVMVDPHLLERINYMPSQYSILENIDANTGGLRIGYQGTKMDDSKPLSILNSMSCGSREHLLWGAQDGGEKGRNDNLVDCVVQSNYPETLDGSFLTLGVGVITEAWSKSNASSRDFISKIDRAINTQLNPSHGQSGYGSSFHSDFKMAASLSDFQTYAGGFSSIEENAVGLSSLKHDFHRLPNIVQDAGESSTVSAFAGSVQNIDGFSFSKCDHRVAVSTCSNFSLSPSQMLRIPQSHVPHPFLTPSEQKFGAGFANIDPAQGFHPLCGVSSNIEHVRSQSGLPPNQSFRTLSDTSPIVHSSRLSGLTVQEQHRIAPRPSVPSFMASEYAAVTSDQLQQCDTGSIPSLQWGTSVASVLGNTDSPSSQSDIWQHYPAHQNAANQTVEKASFSDRIQLQLDASMLNSACASTTDQLFARDRSASQVDSSFPFSKNFAVTTNRHSAGEGKAAEVVNIVPSSNNIGFQAASKVIPFAGGNGLAITSNRVSRPSLKRKAAQPPPAASQFQVKRTVKPSIRSSALHKAKNAPYVAPLLPVVPQAATVPSIAHPMSTVPPVTVAPCPFPPLAHKGHPPPSVSRATPTYPPPVRATTIPPSVRMSSSPYIKWQDTEPFELSGYNCLLCKRDLSYTPEGPVSQPAAPPPVAVLSCGHNFHDLCLQRMTPKDQAGNPPCIPCLIGES